MTIYIHVKHQATRYKLEFFLIPNKNYYQISYISNFNFQQ